MKKILIYLTSITTFALLFMTLSFVNILADDPVDGTFNSTGFNNPTEYTEFSIKKTSDEPTLNTGAQLVPKEEYTFTLGISDDDTLDDLVSIQVHLYYQSFDEDSLTNDASTYVVVEWQKGSDDFVISDSAVTANTTWSVTNSAIPTLTDKAGDFAFDLTVSQVARYSTAGDWQVGLVVVDGDVAEGYDPAAVSHSAIGITTNGNPLTKTASTFDMAWYGEIELTQNNALWTGVSPNQDFADSGSMVTLSGIKYTSNGDYDREVKADDVWNISGPAAADGSTNAALTTDLTFVGSSATPDSTQKFALRVADEDNPSLPTGSDQVIPVGETATVAFAQDKTYTDEDGETVEVYLWLAISSKFQNATYTGEIVLSIVNTTD